MGLGIKKGYDGIYDLYSIPLLWENNKITADHLRYLADEIEKLKHPIQQVRLSTPIDGHDYGKPCLEILVFPES